MQKDRGQGNCTFQASLMLLQKDEKGYACQNLLGMQIWIAVKILEYFEVFNILNLLPSVGEPSNMPEEESPEFWSPGTSFCLTFTAFKKIPTFFPKPNSGFSVSKLFLFLFFFKLWVASFITSHDTAVWPLPF